MHDDKHKQQVVHAEVALSVIFFVLHKSARLVVHNDRVQQADRVSALVAEHEPHSYPDPVAGDLLKQGQEFDLFHLGGAGVPLAVNYFANTIKEIRN